MEKSTILVTMYLQDKLVRIGKFFIAMYLGLVNMGINHRDFTEKQKRHVAYTNRIVLFIAIILGSLVFMTMTYTSNRMLIITHIMIPPAMILAQVAKWGNRFYLSSNLLLGIPTVAFVIFDDQFVTQGGEEGGFFLYFFLMAFIVSMTIRHTTYSFFKILLFYLYPVIGIALCFKGASFFGLFPDAAQPHHIGKTFFFNSITVFSMSTFFLILQMTLNVQLVKDIDEKQKQIIELIEKENLFAVRAVMDAEENEKRRISAELHDGVGQLMVAAKASLDQVKENIHSEYSGEIVSDCIQILKLALQEIRNISHDLMPAILQEEGLPGALEQICRNSKLENGNTIEFDCDCDLIEDIKPDHKTSLHMYRIVQECVGNILKHSKATGAWIRLAVSNQRLVLKISDNGKGFKAGYKGGNGLMNIRNRCSAIGAEMTIETSVLDGTTTTITLEKFEKNGNNSQGKNSEIKILAGG